MVRDVPNILMPLLGKGLTLLFTIVLEISTSISGTIAGEGKGGLE
jgi:hypothetical protein